MEVPVDIDFAHEKNLFFTGFAHPEAALWKSCESAFAVSSYHVGETGVKSRSKNLMLSPLASLNLSAWGVITFSYTLLIGRINGRIPTKYLSS